MTLSVQAGDDLFDILVDAYDASPADGRIAFMARLCLALAHRVGDLDAVRATVREAQLNPLNV